MAVRVYGVAGSTCTKRVLTTLVEKNVPYELIDIDLFAGEQKHPTHVTKQPFGKVPVLDDNGFLIYESRAIAKYIAKKYASQGTKLIPADDDLEEYGLFEQACSIETSYFSPPAEGIAVEKVFKLFHGGSTDEELVKKYGTELDAALSVYDGILGKQKYLGGNEVSLADLSHLPYGTLAKDCGFKKIFEKYPNVDKWFKALEKRDSWVKVNSVTV